MERIASIIGSEYDHPEDLVVVFPNRRAGLFLKNLLKSRSTAPNWAPDIISFQDLVSRESRLQTGDPVMLIYTLYQVYKKHISVAGDEGFERFYFWGKMLLQDFDEIDKYQVDGKTLYKNLLHQKEMDLMFDFLSPEQKEALKSFWQGFEHSRSENKQRFLSTWEKLGTVYEEFREILIENGLAYEGLQYRELAGNLDKHVWRFPRKHVLFAGFNALTRTEEKIMSWCLQNGDTRIEWDLDTYYVNDPRQEAGRFFREYKKKASFAQTFPESIPSELAMNPKSMEILGVPQHVGQTRIAGQKIRDLLRENPDILLHKIAVVLADETLLLPMLHALPREVSGVNVTMGFPLSFAPVNSLIEYLTELQQYYKEDKGFYYEPLFGILRHPLVTQFSGDQSVLIQRLEKGNKVYVQKDQLKRDGLSDLMIQPAKDDFLEYIINILRLLETAEAVDELNRTFIHHYRRHFTRYQGILSEHGDQKVHVNTFKRLFRQLANTEKVPFTGEPLQGIQIMGVLETRNLDFDHVFLLSCNEGYIPSGARQHSFIPYNIRKAYDLPHSDQQDAMYAYLFYRLLQGVKSVLFTWNTEGNDFGEEEMSRFLKQLIYEFPLEVKRNVLGHETRITPQGSITIPWNESVQQRLNRYLIETETEANGISPSALNTYLECSLKFYFKYVAGLYEPDEMEEDLDARTMGSVLHRLMEFLFEDHVKQHGTRVEPEHLKEMEARMEATMDRAFKDFYKIQEGEAFVLEGKNLISADIVEEFARRILKIDEGYAPFDITGLEEKIHVWENIGEGRRVKLTGLVDRVDVKGGFRRIIDYKTGKDNQSFESVEGLFDDKPNKVAFQTFLYTLLYQRQAGIKTNMAPYVFNRKVIFQDQDPRFMMGHKNSKQLITDIEPFMPEFEQHLHDLLERIFYAGAPFVQTEKIANCTFCEFNVICQRAKE